MKGLYIEKFFIKFKNTDKDSFILVSIIKRTINGEILKLGLTVVNVKYPPQDIIVKRRNKINNLIYFCIKNILSKNIHDINI